MAADPAVGSPCPPPRGRVHQPPTADHEAPAGGQSTCFPALCANPALCPCLLTQAGGPFCAVRILISQGQRPAPIPRPRCPGHPSPARLLPDLVSGEVVLGSERRVTCQFDRFSKTSRLHYQSGPWHLEPTRGRGIDPAAAFPVDSRGGPAGLLCHPSRHLHRGQPNLCTSSCQMRLGTQGPWGPTDSGSESAG